MKNPDNLPIVGKENSLDKLREETIREGEKARKESKTLGSCPYDRHSTFEKWWKKGWNDVDLLIHMGRQMS